MLVVADSSALLALAACEGLSLLDAVFGTVRVPLVVYLECTVPEKALAHELDAYLRDKVVTAPTSASRIVQAGLDEGEVEAIALFRHLHADLLLIDDRRARTFAWANRIEFTGSAGVLVRAKDRKLIAAVKPYLIEMRRRGIYLSDHLVQLVIEAAGEG